jgi:hypothetical protein
MNFNILAIWQIWPWRLFLAHQDSQGELLPSFCVVVRPSVHRKLFIQRSSPLKLLGQLKPSLATMVLGWSPFQIVSGRSGSNPRWPPAGNIVWENTLKDVLLWNHLAKWNTTWSHKSLDGLLLTMCMAGSGWIKDCHQQGSMRQSKTHYPGERYRFLWTSC